MFYSSLSNKRAGWKKYAGNKTWSNFGILEIQNCVGMTPSYVFLSANQVKNKYNKHASFKLDSI